MLNRWQNDGNRITKSSCTENGNKDMARASDVLELALLISFKFTVLAERIVTRGWFWTIFWFGLGIKKTLGSHLQQSQKELQKGGAGQVFWGLTDGRTHWNPNPSIQKCRMAEGKPYTIHHRARLHREESSMATSHLKGGQIQQQEQTEKRGKKKGRTDKRCPGRTQSLWCSAFPLGMD